MTNKNLLQISNLSKSFESSKGFFRKVKNEVKAVDGVSFEVKQGETLGIVGESGCGKSTTGRLIMRLIEGGKGKINFEGQDVQSLSTKDLRKLRRDIQMIFQDPYASLNPRHTVEKIIEEPLIVHKIGTKEERRKRVAEVMDVVGLSPYHLKRYPHQFSGGQRQRIGIARALVTNPKLIIADEPVSALDVSIQAQVLNLLKDIQVEFGLTYLFIAHDLGVVRHISDRVAVMYLGRIVEIAEVEELFENPKHPYTKALLSSVPVPDPTFEKQEIVLTGEIPSPSNPPSGCTFHTRCNSCMDICKAEKPVLQQIQSGHQVACHLF
ncbi:MAG: oligopeptide/dipeptide transporter, ATPase subunit [Bacillales bacterium]|jgi:oligopeptide transport system ATP-binding protein|nr:oligopeptide/dipeptide transporter, ATPase subunit [Bacillales bacterium]